MAPFVERFAAIVRSDPAVADVAAMLGGGWNSSTSGRMFISLKPLSQRDATADDVINRLRPKLAHVPGATCFLMAEQELRMGGRGSPAQFQYSLQSEDLNALNEWAPKLLAKLHSLPQLRFLAHYPEWSFRRLLLKRLSPNAALKRPSAN